MAATDQTYRNQYALDIVFAVSSILLLGSTVWMLWDDYQREYKTEQRIFRDVEMAMAQREALIKMPGKDAFLVARKEVDDAAAERKKNQDKIDKADAEYRKLLPEKDRADLKLADHKADLDSKTSFYDIEVEHNGGNSARALALKSEIENIKTLILQDRQAVESLTQKIKEYLREKDKYEDRYNKALGNLKKLLDDFDRQVNLAIKKQWGAGDVFRSIPVLDAYASPTKIEQFTLNDLTIDYNFKGVTRFDRCTTCHKGIARPTFTKQALADLCYEPDKEMDKRLKEAKWILEQRKTLLAELGEGRNLPSPDQLRLSILSDKKLTAARITEFCAHPRQELFVSANSKHPQEKFGCTSCHSGQPSGTSFTFAAHTPNDSKTKDKWVKDHDWEAQHMWDYPMLPSRFVESSCLKCHHQVTDLYSDGNKSEAPKLTKGYDLIREYGCFGCHEINGYKGGRRVGPDIRLEPNTPLDQMTVEERKKAFSDPDNPPGTFRKVGPSLFRVSEKTYEEFARKWIMAPREFRPDTKMPHYYGLSNNNATALKGTGQEKFPAAEVHGIVHYLFEVSKDHVDRIGKAHDPAQAAKVKSRIAELEKKGDKLTDAEKTELADARTLLELRASAQPLDKELGATSGDEARGRDLFIKKGCLACHSHAGTSKDAPSEADFGPNLTQVAEKLVKGGDTKRARLWLTNWLKNPRVHSPKTRMPNTHLDKQEAADIAEWLLNQKVPTDKSGKAPVDLQGDQWASLDVPAPVPDDLRALAKVYLDRTLSDSEVKDFFAGKLSNSPRLKDLGADERELAEKMGHAGGSATPEQLLSYVGKKAIGRLGCYACHDIPGFESAKPIGTSLEEWGKKKSERLAFEDIDNYVQEHYHKTGQIVDTANADLDRYQDLRNHAKAPLYDKYFYDALTHRTLDGYLNQKIMDPRSYDFNRIRAWDDRSRMPQFKFVKVKMKPAESNAEYNNRKKWGQAAGMPVDIGGKPRPAESTADFLARREKTDADNREAVMTFVLGLVAEPIPLQYLNTPSQDRMAEIKGRQVLDKFNCAGCHMLRPGAVEFALTDGTKRALLNAINRNILEPTKPEDQVTLDKALADKYKDDHFFPEHRAWDQATQSGPIIRGYGVYDTAYPEGKPRLKLIPTEALKIHTVFEGKPVSVDLRADGTLALMLPLGDVVWPPREALQTPENLYAFKGHHGVYGGAFATVLGTYLVDKKKATVPGPFVPPSLQWQGERVQPDWMYQFLLDPQKVRELTVLRMPKFNLSEEEARALVNYFAAVEKRVNPDINLTHPYAAVPQRAKTDSDYWKAKNAAYIANLEKSGQYKKEVAFYQPMWEKMAKARQAEAANVEANLKKAEAAAKEAQDNYDKAKDEDKDRLKKELDAAQGTQLSLQNQKRDIDKLGKITSETLEKEWRDNQAYAVASFRLVVKVCNLCHNVANLPAAQPEEGKGDRTEGPSLNLASMRLRPEWAYRWIANPQRFVPYNSAMPQYFKRSDKGPHGEALALKEWLPGTHLEQVGAARDAILNLPTLMEMPLARYWLQDGAK
jgi:mono/diheme cytochrome c family protein